MLCTTLQHDNRPFLMPKGPLQSTIIVSGINLLWQTNSKNKLLMGAWVPVYISDCASLALPDGKMYTSFFNSLYFCPKSRYSFHSNVHATLNLPNLSNYVPFDSVKHRFHPFLADETLSFSRTQPQTLLHSSDKRCFAKLAFLLADCLSSPTTEIVY